MRYNRRWRYGVGVLALVGGLGLSVPQAQAVHISCGDTLGPGGNFVLDSDVGPCSGPGPALTLISATLDLAGHTVSCSTTSIYGIEVEGKKSRVRNGTVSGCGNGVVLFDEGFHEVRRITASGNTTGFTVGSKRNKLNDNTATVNEYAGFAVGGTQNQLNDNFASGSEIGFLFIGATGTVLSDNTATENFEGFEMFNSGSNLLTDNTASDNATNGFEGSLNTNNRWAANTANGNAGGFAFEGNTSDSWISNRASDNDNFGFSFADGGGNALKDNRASGNGLGGFGIEETNDTLLENKATDNINAGFDVFDGTVGTLFRANQALGNTGPGLRLAIGATGNRVQNSKALGNGGFDLQDNNPGCDANLWSNNTFGTANQGCID
jgi:parallel beta-helix repeat protein